MKQAEVVILYLAQLQKVEACWIKSQDNLNLSPPWEDSQTHYLKCISTAFFKRNIWIMFSSRILPRGLSSVNKSITISPKVVSRITDIFFRINKLGKDSIYQFLVGRRENITLRQAIREGYRMPCKPCGRHVDLHGQRALGSCMPCSIMRTLHEVCCKRAGFSISK